MDEVFGLVDEARSSMEDNHSLAMENSDLRAQLEILAKENVTLRAIVRLSGRQADDDSGVSSLDAPSSESQSEIMHVKIEI
jgi:regulator of replication initiation timing